MAEIEIYSTPRRLYRYRSLMKADGKSSVERELDAIINSYILCPTFSEMNDPMEGLLSPSKIFKNDLEIFEVKSKQISTAMSKLGIASFSETYNHEPMWSHYAGQFNGICVAYDFKKLLSSLQTGAFVRMNYSEQAPILDTSSFRPDQMARVALSTKNHRWMTEREWRLFAPSRGPVTYREASAASAIYIGSRVSSRIRSQIFEILKPSRPTIPIFKMSIDGYQIKFGRLLRRPTK
ncbi:DUF2971 domain-containing protein [Mesorhizobium sp. M1136]|uniref:DUF2971 domain-containing protein n=1 Tax=Mesorhizobium sp. M1136 TaxID=2957059 RepID=UPI0033368540